MNPTADEEEEEETLGENAVMLIAIQPRCCRCLLFDSDNDRKAAKKLLLLETTIKSESVSGRREKDPGHESTGLPLE